jgi:hypothetical protein
MKNYALRALSILVFSIGVLVGMAFFITAAWADVESVFYGFNRYGNKLTSTFHCPAIMTRGETGVITLSYKNTSDQRIRPHVRFQASGPGAFRTESNQLDLEPGQSEVVTWTVSEVDLALNRFIFAKVYTFASYPLEDIEQTCGIIMLDLPGISGSVATYGAVALSLLCMAGGIALWYAANKPLRNRSIEVLRAFYALAVVVALGMISIAFAWWLVGVLLAALSLIMVGVIIGNLAAMGRPEAN